MSLIACGCLVAPLVGLVVAGFGLGLRLHARRAPARVAPAASAPNASLLLRMPDR